MIGTWEIILIVLIILMLFGANKIPEFIKALNSGMKEFKKAATNIEDSPSNDDDINNSQKSQITNKKND